MVGLTEEQCKAQGLDFCINKSTFRANGKAVAMGETDGMVKIISETSTGRLLGCHICGPHAADLVTEAALAMSSSLTVEAIAGTIHAHPTLSETVGLLTLRRLSIISDSRRSYSYGGLLFVTVHNFMLLIVVDIWKIFQHNHCLSRCFLH